MANKYRLLQEETTGEFKFQKQVMDARNELYWTDCHLTACPQNREEAIRKLTELNREIKWRVIA